MEENKSLCQLALEHPDDKGLHKLLALAFRDGAASVTSLPEFKAYGATRVTTATSAD